MEIYLYSSSPCYLSILFLHDFDFYILPRFRRPKFENTKKKMGAKWNRHYLKWHLILNMEWLFFNFELKIAKK